MTGNESSEDFPNCPLAPPRKNGEIVFTAPWESRAFAIAQVLERDGRLSRQEFVRLLGSADHGDGYYERLLAVLEQVLAGHGLVAADEIDARATEFASAHDHHP
jgi:Nitrile hydratase beta subunit